MEAPLLDPLPPELPLELPDPPLELPELLPNPPPDEPEPPLLPGTGGERPTRPFGGPKVVSVSPPQAAAITSVSPNAKA